MHILFVDDKPNEKLCDIIPYMEAQCSEFTYDVVKSELSACAYLKEHQGAIDLAVVDLGLPLSDNGDEYHYLRGMEVIDEISRKYSKIPVLINSTTTVETELWQKYAETGLILRHYYSLRATTLLSFAKKGNVHLVEPYSPYWPHKFVFWVDSDDEALIKKYFEKLNDLIIEREDSGEFDSYKAKTLTIEGNKIILDSEDLALSDLIDWRDTDDEIMKLFGAE